MPEKLVIETHHGASAYDFRKDMCNLGKPCRIEEAPDGDEIKYSIYL